MLKSRTRWLLAGLSIVAAIAILPFIPADPAYLREHPSGWWSVLPPLVAIGMAFVTHRVLPSLAVAIAFGGVLSAGPSLGGWVQTVSVTYVWNPMTAENGFKVWILVFTAGLIGMVKVISRMGGNQGLVRLVERIAQGARGTRVATGLLGVAIFFDDYANSIVVGTTMRPLTDRHRISREKLAYLVDSTAAPVAGLAIISTWIGYEVGLFQQTVTEGLGLSLDGYAIFFQALPYRFYCLFTLLFLFVNAFSGRDFGSMLRAERRAARTGQLIAAGSAPASGAGLADVDPVAGAPPRAVNAIVPICVVLAVTVIGMLSDGGGLDDPAMLLNWTGWQRAFGAAGNSTRTLAIAALSGSAVAILLAVAQGILRFPAAVRAWFSGTSSMGWVVLLLILAWGIGATTEDLHTAHYLVAVTKGKLASHFLPLVTFSLAGVIAFATGTSWGTMSILIPTLGPVAYHLGGEGLLVISLAAVLDGSIFGDHCSPISDTTVISSIASSCDHLDHVRTQLPYALTTAGIALLCGYGWTAYGGTAALAYGIGGGLVVVILFVFGRPAGGAVGGELATDSAVGSP